MLAHGVDTDDAIALIIVDVDVVLTIGEGESAPPLAQDAPTMWSLPDKVNETGNGMSSRSTMPFSRDTGGLWFNTLGQTNDLPKSQCITKTWPPWFFQQDLKGPKKQSKNNASTSVIVWSSLPARST